VVAGLVVVFCKIGDGKVGGAALEKEGKIN
jgi:hypothetical protein